MLILSFFVFKKMIRRRTHRRKRKCSKSSETASAFSFADMLRKMGRVFSGQRHYRGRAAEYTPEGSDDDEFVVHHPAPTWQEELAHLDQTYALDKSLEGNRDLTDRYAYIPMRLHHPTVTNKNHIKFQSDYSFAGSDMDMGKLGVLSAALLLGAAMGYYRKPITKKIRQFVQRLEESM